MDVFFRQQFLSVVLFLVCCKNFALAQDQLPSNFKTLSSYVEFTQNQKILHQHVIALPKSPFLLVYIAKERLDDKDNWSMSPADATTAKVFVYDTQQHRVDETQTQQLNKILGADQFYNYQFCGGLGSFETWRVEGTKVVVQQSYAPASDAVECKTYLYYDGKVITATNNANNSPSGLGNEIGKQRNEQNAAALKLLQNNQLKEAILIWEELYKHMKEGNYAAEGKIDEYLNNLGFAYWKAKKYAEAEKILLECLTRFPNRHILYINLADLYRDMGKKQNAKTYYAKVANSSLNKKQKQYAATEWQKLSTQ